MLGRTVTHALVGLEARKVEVEAHLENGVPGLAIVGLADRACQEAKHRVRSGIASAELEWPMRRITVNLAPAALRKEGSGFDLPIALAILAASRQFPPDRLSAHAAIGELALDGRLRPVAGVLAAAEGARTEGLGRLLCAVESAAEAALAGVEPIAARHLAEVVGYLRGEYQPPPLEAPSNGYRTPEVPDLTDVRGQERARRALELAAAGGHNLLLAGPPGIGKSMLARRLPGVLPAMTRDEALEVTRIHSVVGLLSRERPLIDRRPFRSPHHSASVAAIVGGGPGPRPGEATLAHRGVLFLDELPEFQRPVLEALRQPLEDGEIAVARVGGRAVFPARFQLVASMNMCPCGGRGDAGGGLPVLGSAAGGVSGEALASVARPLRPRRRAASTSCCGARRSGGGAFERRRRSRGCGSPPSCGQPGGANRCCDRASRPSGRAAAALGPWPGEGGSRSPDGFGAGGRRRRQRGACG